jgi:UDP-N-acetylmuramoyl-tripeptide--D-alanyl-D-alanine ligase
MGSVEGVAETKGALYQALPADGVAIINADDAFAGYWIDRAGSRRVVTFGSDPKADVNADIDGHRTAAFGQSFRLALPGGKADVTLRMPGRHNAMNALAAAAASTASGIPVATIARGLRAVVPVAGRLVKNVLSNGAVVLDDTYNANPDSVRAAIDVLTGIGGRRVLVLGRMGEVGEQGPAFHREVGAYARDRAIDRLLTLGDEAAEAAEAFGVGGQPCGDIDDLIEAARMAAQPGTTLLVKGSRSARMERVVRALTGHDGAGETH